MHDGEHCCAANAAAGALAGLAGTLALMAMRFFDEHYAPKTLAQVKEDPGMWAVKHAEGAVALQGKLPESAEKTAAMMVSVGYGAAAGAVYGKLRGAKVAGSPLCDGALLGTGVYAVSYLVLLPLAGLAKPGWKQPLPAVVGGLLRHAAFGIATAVTLQAINKFRHSAQYKTSETRPSGSVYDEDSLGKKTS